MASRQKVQPEGTGAPFHLGTAAGGWSKNPMAMGGRESSSGIILLTVTASASLMLAQFVHGLDQRSNVAIRECERLVATRIVRMVRHVIRHHHIRIVDLFVHRHGLDEVDISLVGIDL